MTAVRHPRLSIGLPVFNGDVFLEETIDSLLSQSFEDFELVIADDLSTDRTEGICRAYAKADPRVRYARNEENVGASENFNRVFRLSSGEYFKWAAQDDLHDPEFVRRCVKVLDNDSSVVLAYTRAITIDPQGRPIRKEWGGREEMNSTLPRRRFRAALAPLRDPLPLPMFGVIRTSCLGRTHLLGGFPDSDLALLSELILQGPFAEISEPLFLQREHERRAGPQLSSDPYFAAQFWDARRSDEIGFPHWALLGRHLMSVRKAPLGWRERLLCYTELGRWSNWHRRLLGKDLVRAAESLPAIGPAVEQRSRKAADRDWAKRLQGLADDVQRLTAADDTVILVGEECFDADLVSDRRILPFLERNGIYQGEPADDTTAIRELDRMRGAGADLLVFGWPAFWWLDYYTELGDYLDMKARCVLRNSRAIVFDLQREPETDGAPSSRA